MDNIIGIDIGYGYTKSYTSQHGPCTFPTHVTAKVPEETFGSVKPIVVNGDKFLVGHDALSKWLIDTRTASFLGSNAWLAPLGYALVTSGIEPDDFRNGGHIVLGLPPGDYTKDIARKLTGIVQSSEISKNGASYDLSATQVSVIPQGAGIYYAYKEMDDTVTQKNVAVVDVGFYTVDMVFFVNGQYIEDATYSEAMGVSLLLDDICATFKKQFQWPINRNSAEKLLTKGEITILQEVYRLEQMPTIIQAYAARVSSLIDRYFEGLPVEPDIGIAGGGGVLAMKNHLKLQRKLYVRSDPVTANAMGYYCYGREYAQ